jgi:hypothetical protein
VESVLIILNFDIENSGLGYIFKGEPLGGWPAEGVEEEPEMNTSLRRPIAALAGTIVLLASTSALLAADAPALEVRGITVQDTVVRVELQNLGDTLVSGTLVAQVALGTGNATLVEPFEVAEGQKVFVEIHAPSAVEGVPTLGVVLDDGAPF